MNHLKPGTTRFCRGWLALCLFLLFCSIKAQCQPTFGGITANSYVNFSGNNVTMDSFDSADPNHSYWQLGMTYHSMLYGVYSDALSYNSNSLPSRTSDFTLATDGDIRNANNAEVYGFVDTAPGGEIAIQQYGSVGDLNWVYGGNLGIESGHMGTNNAVFYSKSLPNPVANGWQITWLPVPATLRPNTYFKIGGTWTNVAGIGWTNIGGTKYQASSSGTVTLPTPGAAPGTTATYSMVITNMAANTNWVYYDISQLSGSIFIDAPNVVLWCSNGISLSGNGAFTLNTNSDITIYTAGNINVTRPAVMNNGANYAKALTIYDVAGYTNLAFNISGNFGPAVIYAPSSSVSFGGAGGFYDFIGAIFCNVLSVYGNYNFHYDESLSSESLPIPPWISQQPTTQIVQAGSNATFSVEGGGSSLMYQWYYQVGLSNAISGATNASLTITNAQPSDWGRYSVVVSNPYGSVASPQAFLIVYTNAAATLSGILNSTNGQFQLTVSNAENLAGMPYIIQASTNLTDWLPISTNTSPFIYTDSNAFPQRYYRAVFVQ